MTTRRRLATNALFLYVLTASNYFVGLLIYPYLSRILTVEGFGLVGFSMAYVLLFQVVVEFGFLISTTASISEHRSDSARLSRIVSTTMAARCLLAVAATVLFFASAVVVQTVREHLLMVSLFFVSAVLAAMLPDFYFRGIERMGSIAVRSVATKLLTIVLVLLVVHDESQILLIPVAFIIGNLVALIAAMLSVWSSGIRLHLVKMRAIWAAIREGFSFFVSRLAVSVNQSLGALVLGLKFAPTSPQVGLYTGASRISSAGEMMLIPVSDALYPHMIRNRDYRLFSRIYLFGVGTWFAICAIVFIFATPICVLVLGPDFAAAGDLLRVLLIGTFFAYSSNLFGYNALSPIGLSLHANVAILVSAATNVIAITTLYLSDLITPMSVCAVISSTNVVIFAYRALVFYRHRHRVRDLG